MLLTNRKRDMNIAVTIDSSAPTSPGSPGGGDHDVLAGSRPAGACSGASGRLALLAPGLGAIRRLHG